MQRISFTTEFEKQFERTDYSRQNSENENPFSEYACMGGKIHTFSDCVALARFESKSHKRINVRNPDFDNLKNLV